MKKMTIFMMLAALAMPAMQANKLVPTQASRNGAKAVPAAFVQNSTWGSKTVATKAEVMVWDFESEDQMADWTFIDSDGDGYNWTYFNNNGATTNRMNTHSGEGLIASASFMNNDEGSGGTVLTPDNWMISPQVELGGLLSFWAAGQDSQGYDKEVFGVYVCIGEPTGVNDFVQIGSDITVEYEYAEYLFDLSAYAGQTGCFAIVHHNVTDQFWLNVDDITFDPGYVVVGAPTNLTANPAATTADVAWTAGDNNNAWNLRYREYTENPAISKTWNFESADDYADWIIYDANGDGYNWMANQGSTYLAHEGMGSLYSASYVSGTGGVTPDNWLISDLYPLNGTVTFWAGPYNSYYPDNFAAYVILGDEELTADNIAGVLENAQVAISDQAPEEWTQYTIDLSQYQGQKGRFAIRHYNCYDQYYLCIDDITVDIPGDPLKEWINVDNIAEAEYQITGLTPETTYEVQVQGVYEEGRVSDWTESVLFTTLAEGQEETKYYITGGFNGWLTQDPPELTEEGYTFTAVDDPEGDHPLDFKLLTWGGEDWIWIGGISENEGVDYFDITQGMIDDGIELTLYTDPEGQNFRLPAAGTYTVTLVLEDIKGVVEGAKIVVSKENDPVTVGVNDINSKAVKSVKYVNLAGVESNKPFDGVNIMVTTYTDGTKAAAKVVK